MKPLAILSLPNSGSTWLADTLAKVAGKELGSYYHEFFNPNQNHLMETELRRFFGGELASCYQNIARPSSPELSEFIKQMWLESCHGFTKEVFSPFMIESFAETFRVVVLLRHTSGVFPPSRIRVWSFYEHAWQAMKDRGFRLQETTLRAKAYEAHFQMARHMRETAISAKVPIIYYEDLFDDELIEGALVDAGLAYPGVVEELRNTRRLKKVRWDAVY